MSLSLNAWRAVLSSSTVSGTASPRSSSHAFLDHGELLDGMDGVVVGSAGGAGTHHLGGRQTVDLPSSWVIAALIWGYFSRMAERLGIMLASVT
jgi:hypothetical protein